MSYDPSASKVTRTKSGQLDIVTLSRAACQEFYISASPAIESDRYSIFQEIVKFVNLKNAHIVTQQVFGGCRFHSAAMDVLKKNAGQFDWPVMWLQGDGCTGPNLSGTAVYAIACDSFKPLVIDGKAVGAVFEDNQAQYCMLGNMLPPDKTLPRPRQARSVFEQIESALKLAQMDFSNVVRSWFYLDRILDWYSDFNKVRTTFFNERDVFKHLMPASTGIGSANYAKAALAADIFAMRFQNKNVTISEVPSPLQCSAANYKSSFARAVEINHPEYRKLCISGTASISPDGKTAHLNDTEKQIALTMEVVHEILISRSMDWSNASRAIAYFRDITEKPLFDQYCKTNNLPALPVISSHCHVCRDDLLFELELDAITG